jgi:hypothetical protein
VHRLDVQTANVVQTAVVGLADERIDRPNGLVASLLQRPAYRAFNRCPHAESVRQDNRSFDRAELVDLR